VGMGGRTRWDDGGNEMRRPFKKRLKGPVMFISGPPQEGPEPPRGDPFRDYRIIPESHRLNRLDISALVPDGID
jgi:hypothetical protein